MKSLAQHIQEGLNESNNAEEAIVENLENKVEEGKETVVENAEENKETAEE